MTERKYTREILDPIVRSAVSISDVIRALGKRPAGGSYELIKARILEFGLDTSHFLGRGKLAGKRNPNYNKRKSPVEVLVGGYRYRASHNVLKRAMIESGVPYECNTCLIHEWGGVALTLDIDHVDGDWSNCVLSNLRFLCPNCHRQTKTFGGGNKKGPVT